LSIFKAPGPVAKVPLGIHLLDDLEAHPIGRVTDQIGSPRE
jgi:hypothetical protein